VIDGRVYFGCEDGFFYCLNLEDGSLVYKTERLGSMEGSLSAAGDHFFIGTGASDLFCLNVSDWLYRLESAHRGGFGFHPRPG